MFRSNVLSRGGLRWMASKIIKTPPMADSIQEGTLTSWSKTVGQFIQRDEPIATIETDKVDITVNSPESGVIKAFFTKEGETIQVGSQLFEIDTDATASSAPNQEAPKSTPAPPKQEAPKPAPVAPKQAASKPNTPVQSEPTKIVQNKPMPKESVFQQAGPDSIPGVVPGSRTERHVPISRMRARIAQRLKESQNISASLTTFNEIDMTALINLRKKYKVILVHIFKRTPFLKNMESNLAFLKASTLALQEIPQVNARIEQDKIIFQDFIDISIAVATPKGLVTPVLRNCETLSMIDLEKTVAHYALKAKENKITIEDMVGGTFTISNGGVYGSLMGTPILNQPQSAILGMHAIKERPVAINGEVVIRPMMYVALTYDHRMIDGREAVTFLVTLKNYLEDPSRMLIDV